MCSYAAAGAYMIREANQLVEEFMLLANRTVAKFISQAGRRVSQKYIWIYLAGYIWLDISVSSMLLYKLNSVGPIA
jgi:hypothetical protein